MVYLLGRDLDQVLEIKCDLSVVKNYSRKETLAYMRTIKNQLERTMDMEKTVPVGSLLWWETLQCQTWKSASRILPKV